MCTWLIHIIRFCLPFLFVFFLLPFVCVLPSLLALLLSLTFQNMDPLLFQAGSYRRRPNLGLVCFVSMFAVFLVKDACLFLLYLIIFVCDVIVVSPVVGASIII